MKFKYKALIGTSLVLVFVLAVQIAFQFMDSYRWVGFEKKEGSWYGIAMNAQAYNSSCQIELEDANKQIEQLKEARDQANADILK